jgi:formate hydrogenlyase subunit 4
VKLVNVESLAILSTVLWLFMPVILDGVERKLKAALQSRIGPPIVQTLYDLLKLASKEYKPLHAGTYVLVGLVACMVSSAVSLYYVFTYLASNNLTYLFYSAAMFAVSASVHISIPLLVANPFSQMGAWRGVVLSLVNEAFFLLSVAILANSVGGSSLVPAPPWRAVVVASALLLLLLSSYVTTERTPFDIAEAEPELASGVLVEFSGPLLAANIYSLLLKRAVAKALAVAVIVAAISSGAATVLLAHVLMVLMWVVFAAISVVLGRTRVDVGPLSLARAYIALMALIITALLVGARA